jgi:hypothetical protein
MWFSQSRRTAPMSTHIETGFKYRDALRLLFILWEGAAVLDPPDEKTGAVRVFEGEKRLYAIDFWLRYPDYLAEELLTLYETERDANILTQVEAIFDNEEPSVRVVKMLRWKRGAFDHIEDALAVISARKLVLPVMKPLPGGGYQHNFLIYEATLEFLNDAVTQQPSLSWYRDRTQLAMRVAQQGTGYALKSMQYEVPEYEKTTLGAWIPSIQDRVKKRFLQIKAEAA